MDTSYTGILRDNHIEWTSPAPILPAEGVHVQVTLLEQVPAPPNQGQRMASALACLAANGGVATITDPHVWERETRTDRDLPRRDWS